MTISEYIIQCLQQGHLRINRLGRVYLLGQAWIFHPDPKYGPGYLTAEIAGSVMSTAEMSDRLLDPQERVFAAC